MKKFVFPAVALLFSTPALACSFCNKEVSSAIYNSAFYPNLFTMLSAFIVLAVIVAGLWLLFSRRHKRKTSANLEAVPLTPVPLSTASIILGIGMGGLIDGIILHQILQWHEMLSNKIPATNYVGKSVNMFWDGVFHGFCFLIILLGAVLLWKITKRSDVNTSGRLFSGGLLTGWGIFNIVEGIIDHHILKLHNVMEFSTNHDIGNYSFQAFSIIILLLGLFLVKQGEKE